MPLRISLVRRTVKVGKPGWSGLSCLPSTARSLHASFSILRRAMAMKVWVSGGVSVTDDTAAEQPPLADASPADCVAPEFVGQSY